MVCVSNCKKGSALGVLTLIISLVVIVTSIFLGNAVWNEIIDSQVLEDDKNTTAHILDTGTLYFGGTTDNLIFAIFVGLALSSLLMSVLSRANPIFLYVSIIFSMFLVLIAVIMNNWYATFSSSPEFSSFIVNYPKTTYIFDHLPLLTLLTIVMTIIALYAVRRGQRADF